MEEIIKRIIEIENKAQKAMKSAKEEKKAKEKEFENTLIELEEKIMEEAYSKIKQIREIELDEIENQAKEEKEKCNYVLEKMEEKHRKNAEKWKNEIVSSIIKRWVCD